MDRYYVPGIIKLPHLKKADDGPWVRHADAQAEIARLTARAEKAEAYLSESQSMLAMAYEVASRLCDETADEALEESGPASRMISVWFRGQAKAIRALTPADAQAALAAVYRDRDNALGLVRSAYDAGYIQAENGLPNHGDRHEAATAALDARDKATREQALDTANRYMTEQYGISAIGNPIDRLRILAKIKEAENG